MKRILFVVVLVTLFVANVLGQKADLEKSQFVSATRENGGKIFRVKVKLKDVGTDLPDSTTVRIWKETFLRCFVNKDNFVQATLADESRLEYNCDFEYLKIRELATLPIRLTFSSKMDEIVTSNTIYATPIKNNLNIKTTISDPVWNQNDSFITVPINVNQSVSVTISLDCTAPNSNGNYGKEVYTLTKDISNSVKVNLKAGFTQGMDCKINVSEGDSLTDIADFYFLDNNSKDLKPKEWKAVVNEQYKLSISFTEALKDKAILVNSFTPKALTITTTKAGNLQMLIDNKPEGDESIGQINHKFTISKETIVRLANQKVQHTITFKNSQTINETFPLLIDINTKLETSKINFSKDKKLQIEYTLSRPVQTYLKFPELSDF